MANNNTIKLHLSNIFIMLSFVILAACSGDGKVPLPSKTDLSILTESNNHTTKVKIDSPLADSKVLYVERIRGVSKLLPSDKKIWIVVFPLAANKYYPQDRYADIQPDGQWSSVAYIGIKDKNLDEHFDIVAVLVNPEAQQVFEKYSRDSKANQEWLGIDNLPEGSQVYDRISVVRK